MAHAQEPAAARTRLARAVGLARRHAKAASGVLATLAAVAGILAVLLPGPLIRPGGPGPDDPSPELSVAAFDVGVATRAREITSGSAPNTFVETVDGDVARVQVGLRNTGDAPVFVTRAVLTVREHVALDSCVEWGDAVAITESVDVDLPLQPTAVPWTHEEPISFRVAPNEVDRLELTFSVRELPPNVQPAAVSVDVALVHDAATTPVPVGTARMLVPATNVAVALEALTADPVAPADRSCNLANLGRLEEVLAAPALRDVGTSVQLTTLHAALVAYAGGAFYEWPDGTPAPVPPG